MANKSFHTSALNLAGASTKLQTLWLGSPSPAVTRLWGLYKRVENKGGWGTWIDGNCSSHIPLLNVTVVEKKYNFCMEDLSCECIICPHWHYDTFVPMIAQNWLLHPQFSFRLQSRLRCSYFIWAWIAVLLKSHSLSSKNKVGAIPMSQF